jgi:hypothetical protein
VPVAAKYQLAGVDERERGFSRPVEVQSLESGHRAMLRYEKTIVSGDGDTSEAAMASLVGVLQDRGYTQLKSQLSFRGAQYLGNQEPWVEYSDPQRPPAESVGLAGWLRTLAGRLWP